MGSRNDWITVREAASLLQVSSGTLLRWRRHGAIRGKRQEKGGQVRVYFRRGDLLGLLRPSCETAHDLLTKAGTAELLGIDERTVHRWLNDGHLPCFRLRDRSVRVRQEDIEALRSGDSPDGSRLATCAICGAKARYIGVHVRRDHGLKPSEYKRQFPGWSLWANDVREQCRTAAKESAERSRKVMRDAGDLMRICHALSPRDRERLMATAREFLAPDQVEDLRAGRKIRRAKRPR